MGAASVAVGATLVFVGWVFSPAMRAGLAPTLQIAGFLLPLLALLGLASANLKGFKRAATALLPETTLIPVVVSFIAAALYLATSSELTARQAMAVHFASALIVLAAVQLIVRRETLRVSSPVKRQYRTAEWVSTAKPLLFMSGMAIVVQRTGTLLVGVFVGTTEAGNFSIAARIAMLITFALSAVNAIAAPMIAEMYARGEKVELQKMLRHAALVILAFTAPVCVGILVLGRWLLELFDEAYAVAYLTLACLSLGQTVSVLVGPVAHLLIMTGHQVDTARATAATAGLSIALHLILVPSYGLAGAGIASALAMTALNVGQWHIVWTRVGVDSSVLSLLRRGPT
ncbi:MAG: polysaccharide biosynthesis C-terminal domain-containing protein [Candidatus Hydrogenedentes bacterium]|nr:polysaccharide biosynthesis C-terminal domain-containing protein [Candidatus Hydrogenedentota bacterium]